MHTSNTQVQFLSEFDHCEFVTTNFVNYRFPIHFHDTFVIQLVHSGADWCCRNGLTARKNEVFVHFPYSSHTGGTLAGAQLAYRAIYPSINLFCELAGVNESRIPRGNAFVVSDQNLLGTASEFFVQCESGPDAERLIRRKMKRMFDSIMDYHDSNCCEEKKGVTPIHEKMLLARNYLAVNFHRDVSVAELGNHCELSRYYLIRTFKLHFGITPRQFLISQRVAVSKQLISAGVPISQAALQTGFADQSHLTRNFKRITSYNPGKLKG